MLVALSVPVLSLAAFVGASKCTFGQPCWPSASAWESLNATLSGQLLAVLPPAAPCHANADQTINGTLCDSIKATWNDSLWRASQPGASEWEFWEDGNAPCSIDAPSTAPCGQGLVPVIAAAVATVADVQSSVAFAAENNLLLVVKNTGHDVVGRASGAGSFSIWTHNLKGLNFTDSFTPTGCAATNSTPAVTVQAGEQWGDVYAAADALNVVVVGGSSRSVGAAGGWVLGGGHSALSPTFGLGVDNALQFTIVTPNATFHTVNACTDPDLFWALRGGGGSTFGVITSVTFKTHPPLQNFLVAVVTLSGSTAAAAAPLTAGFLQLVPTLSDSGWSGFAQMTAAGTTALVMQPSSPFWLDVAQGNSTGANATFAPLFELGGAVQTLFVPMTSWLAMFDAFIPPDSVGSTTLFGSRLLNRTVLSNRADDIAALMNDPALTGELFMVAGGAVSTFAADSAAVHPSWRSSIALLDLALGFTSSATAAAKAAVFRDLTARTQQLAVIAGPQAGSYFNEADPNEPRWRDVFWGPNYARLLAIKRRVDPAGVFTCNKCVRS